MEGTNGRPAGGRGGSNGSGGDASARPSFAEQHHRPSQDHQPQHSDSSLLTLASISYGQQPLSGRAPGAVGSPRVASNDLQHQSSDFHSATSPPLAPRAPTMVNSQTSPGRLPPAPHLSQTPPVANQPLRPAFPLSSQSSSGLFPSHQPAAHLIPPSSSSSNGAASGGGGASPFSTSPFAAPGSRALFLSSSYDAYGQDRESAFPTSLPASTMRDGGGRPGGLSATRRSFLDHRTDSVRSDYEADDGGAVEEESSDGEEFLPSSLSELLTEHEMERRMTRRNSNQPHSTAAGGGRPLFSTSVNATFPINRLYSDSGLYTKKEIGHLPRTADQQQQQQSWIESAPPRNAPEDDFARTISRRHSERPAQTFGGGDVFGGRSQDAEDDGLSRSPPPPQSMFDSTHTLRPNAFNAPAGPSTSYNDPFKHIASTSVNPTRSNLAALWDRSSSGIPSSSGPQTRHGFNLSSSPHVPPPAASSRLGGNSSAQQPVMSPSSRALASHAPGMSLPGGLGVTLSRLHFQPPMSTVHVEQASSYTSNGLPDLAGLAFGNVGRAGTGASGAGSLDPWRRDDSFPPLPTTTNVSSRTIHSPKPIKSGPTVADRDEEDDEFGDDVLFD